MDTYSDLLKEYRKLAKRADQRLVRLESYSHQSGLRAAKTYAYRKAINSIQSWGGTKRFNTKAPETTRELAEKINDIKMFLEAPTSTARGIRQINAKRTQKLNETLGTNYTVDELTEFFDVGGFGNILMDNFGYRTALTVGKIVLTEMGKHKKKELKKNIDKILESVTFIDDAKALDKAIKDKLKGYVKGK